MPPIMQIFIAVVIISAIVGAVAQFLSKINAQQNNNNLNARRQNAERNANRGSVRQSTNDVDRFLAEIDRLRQRNAEPQAAAASNRAASRTPKPRPVAIPVQPAPVPRTSLNSEPIAAYAQAPSPITSVNEPRRVQDLPVATVIVSQPAEPTTVVTMAPASLSAPIMPRALPTRRSTPTPGTDFARHLASILGSKEGVPMAVVLTEIFGKPKSQG